LTRASPEATGAARLYQILDNNARIINRFVFGAKIKGLAMPDDDPALSEEEIALRMNNAVRRALNTPPKPLKEVVGKNERAKVSTRNRGTRHRQKRD